MVIFLACKFYKKPIKENIDIDLKATLAEALLFTFIIGWSCWILSSHTQYNLLIALAIILSISFVTSYNYLISPLQYLFSKNKYYTDEKIDNIISAYGYKYNVRIIDRDINNAYAIGILPYTKTILLGDNLVKSMSSDQIKAIIFHEIGHLKLKHLNKLYFINLCLATTFYCMFLFRQKNLFLNDSVFVEVISVALIGALCGLLSYYIPGKVQYKFELQADAFAASTVGKENIISALQALDRLSDGNVSKGGVTHPPLEKRIENIRKI